MSEEGTFYSVQSAGNTYIEDSTNWESNRESALRIAKDMAYEDMDNMVVMEITTRIIARTHINVKVEITE